MCVWNVNKGLVSKTTLYLRDYVIVSCLNKKQDDLILAISEN